MSLPKKTELFISISVIVLSVFASEYLIHKYIFAASTAPEAIQSTKPEITRGARKRAPLDVKSVPLDVNWSERSKTLILALQTSCHFCNESAPFYKRLISSAEGKNVKLVAVLPSNVEESRDHLNKLGLSSLDVKTASLDSIQVEGTPTLILVDDKGEIIDSWVGKLPPETEAEVIRRVTS